MTSRNLLIILFIIAFGTNVKAQNSAAAKSFIASDKMKGASLAYVITDLSNGKTIDSYDSNRLLTPASVMKVVTTTAALSILGEDYRYPTTIEYDGTIDNGTLYGNLYIKGSGDPTLGSSHLDGDKKEFLRNWVDGIKDAGITCVNGKIIADESIFDTEGVSPKWVYEDLGSDYGAGSYGLSVFDNKFSIFFKTGAAGTTPIIIETEPAIDIDFHNYLKVSTASGDSCYIIGAPFCNERYLYGTLPPNKERYKKQGDIPDPALFLAKLLKEEMSNNGIQCDGDASTYRIEKESGRLSSEKREELITTYSPKLLEIVKICNFKSHNLYADAICKTLGQRRSSTKGESVSSIAKGTEVVTAFWKSKGLDVDYLMMKDGSGLAASNKVSASFLAKMLAVVAKDQKLFDALYYTLPKAGVEGSVVNFLKETKLQGKAKMKSGSMSGVRTFIGYISVNGKKYAVAIMANNYSCSSRQVNKSFEKILLDIL